MRFLFIYFEIKNLINIHVRACEHIKHKIATDRGGSRGNHGNIHMPPQKGDASRHNIM